MDINTSNIFDGLDRFKSALQGAKYVALDLEMTGITLNNYSVNFATSLEERYTAMREVSSQFGIIQVGFCVATEHTNTDGNTYITLEPFNIYTFPDGDDAISNKAHPMVRLSSSAMKFLTSNNMDYNRWIKDGISITRRSDNEQYQQLLAKKISIHDQYINKTAYIDSSEYYQYSAKDQDFVTNTINNITSWCNTLNIHDDNNNNNSSSNEYIYRCPIINYWMYKTLSPQIESILGIPLVDTHVVRTSYEKGVHGSDNDGDQIIIHIMTHEYHTQYVQKQIDDETKRISIMRGAQLFWSALVDSGLPLVAHNCLYDLTFLYHAFEDVLPQTYTQFVTAWTALFPSTWDTKYLTLHPDVAKLSTTLTAETALGPLFKVYHQHDHDNNTQPYCILHPDEAYQRYSLDKQAHEGGYDAMMTAELYALIIKAIRSAPEHTSEYLERLIDQCDSKIHSFGAYYHYNLLSKEQQLTRYPWLYNEPQLRIALTQPIVTWFNYPTLPQESIQGVYVGEVIEKDENKKQPVAHISSYMGPLLAQEEETTKYKMTYKMAGKYVMISSLPPLSQPLVHSIVSNAHISGLSILPFDDYLESHDHTHLESKTKKFKYNTNKNDDASSNSSVSLDSPVSSSSPSLYESLIPSTIPGIVGMAVGALLVFIAHK